MSPTDTAILVLLAAAVILLIWLLVRQRSAATQHVDSFKTSLELLKAELAGRQAESALAIRETLDKTGQLLNERLAEGTGSLDKRMEVLGDLQRRIGELATQAANIEQVGRNIQSLSELLRPPKLRGSVGEQLLENLLAQILPRALFDTQYRFPDGVRVDAVVKLGDSLLPIDAKFPLEAFERLQQEPADGNLQKAFSKSFRQHVDAIADKYIRPADKTTTFALMYIPAEAVYYQLIAQEDQAGFDYAVSRRVIPSSPGHLYAFLSSVASLQAELELAGKGLVEHSRQLLARIAEVTDSADRLIAHHRRLESSLRGVTAAFDKAKNEAERLRTTAERLQRPFDATPGDDESAAGTPDADHPTS